MSRHLRRVDWGVAVEPLKKPYDLSFAQLTRFDIVWVAAEDADGRVGLGEAVPLPGYNWETLDSIRNTVAALLSPAPSTESALVERCQAVRAAHPFAASAVMAALDLPQFLDCADGGKRFAISAAVAGEWPLDDLRRVAESHLAAGYGFLKCKVGRDVERDIAAARLLLTELRDRKFRVVFDANQAYAPDAALAFARALERCASERLQWFEQPVDRDDWDALAQLCRDSRAPIVLDESIYGEADIARAARIGAHGVKLKLIKNFGIRETLRLAHRARESGLTVVFGNGVASDIGNLGEYLVLAAGGEIFTSPAECSGFAKLRAPLLDRALAIDEHGRFHCRMAADELAPGLRRWTSQALAECHVSTGVSR